MENDPKSVLVVFGENVHFREGKNFIEQRESKTHPIQDYVSEAAGNLMWYDYQHSQMWAVGGDTTNIGISEAEQISNIAQDAHPEIKIDSRNFTKPQDTYYGAETVSDALDEIDHDVKVSTEFPITHRFRAIQQLRQNGVKIKEKHWAEADYIQGIHSTKGERNERRRKLRRILIRPNVYFEMVRENFLYGIGFIDRRGKFMRKISDRFRGQSEEEVDHDTFEIYDSSVNA